MDDMVTKKVIQTLYRQFKKPPKSPDELNIGLLFDYALDNHGIFIDEENIYIGSVEPSSPFASIALKRIHEIVEFETVIAIVLPAAIVFLNKEDSEDQDRVVVQHRPLHQPVADAYSYLQSRILFLME